MMKTGKAIYTTEILTASQPDSSHDVGVALMFNRESVSKSAIGNLGIQLRDLFATDDQAAMTSRPPVDYSPSAVERLFREYDPEIVRLIKQVIDGAVGAGSGDRALARFLIGTQGERGKKLLRRFYDRDYGEAAEIVLRILEDQQPRSFDRPQDWV